MMTDERKLPTPAVLRGNANRDPIQDMLLNASRNSLRNASITLLGALSLLALAGCDDEETTVVPVTPVTRTQETRTTAVDPYTGASSTTTRRTSTTSSEPAYLPPTETTVRRTTTTTAY